MSTQIQFRRGTTAQHAAFTGALAEVTVDTDKKTVVVHDGTTAGGTPLAKETHTHTASSVSVSPSGGISSTDVQGALVELDSEKANTVSPNTSGTFTHTGGFTLDGLQKLKTGANIASASTINLSTATGNTVHITGTTSISAVTLSNGQTMNVIFDGILTLTHNSTTNNLPGGANITTAVGDRAVYFYDGTTTYCLVYQKANGKSVVLQTSLLTLGTAVNSTSGTFIDFTGIPSTTNRITINFDGISTNGSSDYQIQIGDSGGITTSGYLGSSSGMGGAVGSASFTTGFGFISGSSTVVMRGSLVLNRLSGNSWIAYGVSARSNTASTCVTAGSKTLTGTLDRIRFTTVNGTDTFDAGVINISYE